MANQFTCPHCGAEVSPSMKFCISCGSPLPPSVFQRAAPQSASAAPTTAAKPTNADGRDNQADYRCPYCGFVNGPTDAFCHSCGKPLAATPYTAPAQTADIPTASESTTISGGFAGKASSGLSDFNSRLNSYMGLDVDFDAIGSDFNPHSVGAAGVSNSDLAAAFAYFSKNPTTTIVPSKPSRAMSDRRTEQEDAVTVQSAAEVTYGKRASHGWRKHNDSGLSFAANLSEKGMPRQEYIDDLRATSQLQTAKNRIKTRVDLGEIDQAGAVEEYKKEKK